ncbi:MAG: hypothetical protein MJ025_06960 [Victivallaceae bacterium]|nr:hypothetical protein [Victivallaceae bacterium]
MEDLAKATVRGLAEKLASGSITSKEICEGYLGRIDAHEADIHAFLKIEREAGLWAAAPVGQVSGS